MADATLASAAQVVSLSQQLRDVVSSVGLVSLPAPVPVASQVQGADADSLSCQWAACTVRCNNSKELYVSSIIKSISSSQR